MSNHGHDTKTDLDRLRDAVVEAAREWLNVASTLPYQDQKELDAMDVCEKALLALDAHTAPRATAETVRVAVWEDSMGEIMLVRPNGFRDQQFRDLQGHGHDCLGTTTLRLDTEAEG